MNMVSTLGFHSHDALTDPFVLCTTNELVEPAPMLDALAAGFRECKLKPIVGPKLQLDGFLDGMLRRWAS
jgi:hypothetical protein